MGFLDRLFGGDKQADRVPGGAFTPSTPMPRVAVRLRPVVPIPPDRRWRSWLGGNPRVPESFEWPQGDGKPFHFVAQIDCAELPAELWHGAGPRRGWLVFFVGTRGGYVASTVMHVATLGDERPAPTPWAPEDMRLTAGGHAPVGWRNEPPGWPVDVLVHRENDSSEVGDAPLGPPPDRAAFDPSRAEHQPHDWMMLRTLLQLMLRQGTTRRQSLGGSLEALVAAQHTPPAEQEALAVIAAEARAAAERFSALDVSQPWEPSTWASYAQAAARWRTILLRREMEAGRPLPIVAAQLMNYATALIRAVPVSKVMAPADPLAYQRLLVAREECVARSKAMHADSRLPPILVGEGGAKRRNEEGYRAFRAERSELWSELAGLLQAAFAELLGLEVALRPAKRPDDTVVFTYSHVWPQSWDAAGALVHEWAPSSERAAASAARPRPDASDKIAAGRATLAAVEGVEAGLKALATESADAEARGGAFAWEDWRARLEPLLAAANEHRAIDARRVLSDWDDFRSLHLARAYTRDPVGHGLPAPTLAYFVDRWRREAQIRVAGMGGTSQGYTDLVEPEDDRTQLLLELPENRLFGWSWGDDNTLVVAVARDALQRAELGGVVTGVTNGSR